MTSWRDITTLAVGGEIENFLEPQTTNELIKALQNCSRNKISPLYIIGYGANTLASDKPFPGTVIRPQNKNIVYKKDGENTILEADAGVNFQELVELCLDQSLAGLESLIGIPGTVGAAPVQNIGAYGSELSDCFLYAKVFCTTSQKILTLTKKDMKFSYRNSILKSKRNKFCQSNYIVLSAAFKLKKQKEANLKSQLAEVLNKKKSNNLSAKKMNINNIAKNVLELRAEKGTLIDPEQRTNGYNTFDKKNYNYDRWSCGSFFTNPIVDSQFIKKNQDLLTNAPIFPIENNEEQKRLFKLSAGWLITSAGIKKGFSLNKQAAISNLNALSITNRGQAQSKDILELAQYITDKVFSKFSVKLIPEVNIINSIKDKVK